MNTHVLVKVRRMFSSALVSPATQRHNQREWVRAMRKVGAKHLLAHPVTRKETIQ